jgi:hypothetical protein
MGNLVDNQKALARIANKMVKVLKEHDQLIKPGATPSDLEIDAADLNTLESLAGEMVDPETPAP